ncbi:protein EFR3 homolog stmA isoform X2 [Oratosquilla oratoria]|uniref:protein EFR3 homolog stmA isoform X2 n=1 Tax=Oratosquilla oratoria TaxID=337810 RepID=UPI003F7578EA
MAGAGCCGCCAAFRPRYKRHVDSIFPPSPEQGLVKSKMECLIFYAMNNPDKLDSIGDYLAQRLLRDIHRRRTGYVIITMDALDQLLVSCRANNLNLFVESFLKMVQNLLESIDPQLQLRATQSFEKFANISEETPSYHRRYDFLVSKFSSMCYSDEDEEIVKKALRRAGIKGLQGVVRKTDCDTLGENIWLPTHMDKIVPALLFNIQEKNVSVQETTHPNDVPDNQPEGDKEPHELAEMCLREIVSRATYGRINNVVKPILTHLDLHNLWVPNDFAVATFRIIMYSIQTQYSITVIELLMAHLNEKSTLPPQTRTAIANVLAHVIPIAAGECIGPSVIEIINSLLEHIRASVMDGANRQNGEDSAEKLYQEALIHALGEYANHLPDYQKIDSMIFILNKVPGSNRMEENGSARPKAEIKLQQMLLRSLLKVGTKYTTVQYSAAFAQSFLVRLMRVSVARDPSVRLTVQWILHTLIDRHNNKEKFSKPTLEESTIAVFATKPGCKDVNFWKKSGNEILLSLQENCECNNNSVANYDALYTTFMLLLTEIRFDDVIVDILRVLFHIQTGVESGSMNYVNKIQVHVVVGAMMAAIAYQVPALQEHVGAVIKKRSEEAPHMLPELREHYDPRLNKGRIPDHLLFDNGVVFDVLKNSNLDEKRLNADISSMKRRMSTTNHSNSETDLNSIGVVVDSAASSPGMPRKAPEEEITFESLKKVLNESPEQRRKQEEEKRRQITEAFMTESFEALVAKLQAKQPDTLQTKLSEIFSRLPPTCPPPVSTPLSSCETVSTSLPSASYQFTYPDLFIY